MAGKDSSTAIIVIVIMMVTILAIGSGWYILNGDDDKKDKKKGSECPGPDVNAVYQYDDDGNCVRVSCKTGYWDEGGFCIERRDFSEEQYEGTDCVIDGYTRGACELKINGSCGEVGGGSQLREPNITAYEIGSGTCQAADYVDCVVPCPDTCKVTDDKYTARGDQIACKKDDIELGVESGYCGSGTQARYLNENNIDLEGTGYTVLQDYLDWANPNNICATDKEVVTGVCKIDCTGGLTDIGCGIIQEEQAYIQDEYGNAVCFDKEEATAYISGNLTRKPARLPVILAADVRKEDGTYDVDGIVAESLRKGSRILYRSDNLLSFDSMVKNDCTVYSTEPCDAPRESVACAISETNRSECQSTGCGRQGAETVSYGITTHPFGSTGGSTNTCPVDYITTGYETYGCGMAASCCDETYVGPWVKTDGYKGCVADGSTLKRESTRQGNGDLCSADDVKYEDDDNCNYIEGVKKVVYEGTDGNPEGAFSQHYMLLNYIDSGGTTHYTGKLGEQTGAHQKTFNTPVTLTHIQGGLWINSHTQSWAHPNNPTADAVLDVKVYDEDDILLKTFRKVYPVGEYIWGYSGHYLTDKPGSEDWHEWANGDPVYLQWRAAAD